jgi:hypothetical protein
MASYKETAALGRVEGDARLFLGIRSSAPLGGCPSDHRKTGVPVYDTAPSASDDLNSANPAVLPAARRAVTAPSS